MEQQATTDKKAYTMPALTVHGAVQDLTQMPDGDDSPGSCLL